MRAPVPAELMQVVRDFYARSTSEGDDLADCAHRFIDLKRCLGHKYQSPARSILQFLAFQQARHVRRAGDLTTEAVLAWLDSRRHLRGLALKTQRANVSAFLSHLYTLGLSQCRLDLCLVAPRQRSSYRPYIFSAEELRRILEMADAAGPARDRGLAYTVTYACALRGCETAHLKLRDLDAGRKTLFIRQTKFGKDRLLPLHPAVLARIECYRAERRRGAAPDEPLLLNSAGRAWTRNALGYRFKEDLKALEIYRPTKEVDGIRWGSPRLHGLRHSFAVHRLLRWYRQGVDVQRKLPLLSTYLGHSDVINTQVYLTITGLLLREAHSRFSSHMERNLPLSP